MQMLSYRQQIETLENHLASLHQPNRLSSEGKLQTTNRNIGEPSSLQIETLENHLASLHQPNRLSSEGKLQTTNRNLGEPSSLLTSA